MNIAIVGSRDFPDDLRIVIYEAIKQAHWIYAEKLTIVSGGARGPDTMGEEIAKELGIPTIIHLPDWNRYGKRAGFIRNMDIVRDANIVYAFFAPGPKSKGTSHTVNEARIKGVPVHIYHEGAWTM
jgi:hypothetical protein